MIILLFSICFVFCVKLLTLSESVNISDSWSIRGRFCFKKISDRYPLLSYRFSRVAFNNTFLYTNIYFYDTDLRLSNVISEPYPCYEKSLLALHSLIPSNQTYAKQMTETINDTLSNRCVYILLGSCFPGCNTSLCQSNIVIDYELVIYNTGYSLSKHISQDEEGMIIIIILFLIITTLATLCMKYIERQLKRMNKLHHTVRILTFSLYSNFIAYILFLIYYGMYATYGQKNGFFSFLTLLFFYISDFLLTLLLILLAKGWTIVRHKISATGRLKITIFFSFYSITSLASLIWKELIYDIYEARSMYDNLPGYFITAMNAYVIIWFGYSIYTTIKQFSRKVGFYKKFTVLSLCYFIYRLVLMTTIDSSNEKIRVTLFYSLYFISFLFVQIPLLILYMPNFSFNSSFPFHQTTDFRLAGKGEAPVSYDDMKITASTSPTDFCKWYLAQSKMMVQLSQEIHRGFGDHFKDLYPSTVKHIRKHGTASTLANLDEDQLY